METNSPTFEMIVTDARMPDAGSLAVELSACLNGCGAARPAGMTLTHLVDHIVTGGEQWCSLMSVVGQPAEGPVDLAGLIGKRLQVRVTGGWHIEYLNTLSPEPDVLRPTAA